MRQYEKPMLIVTEEYAEGIYASSGQVQVSCDSKYMNGVFRAPDYSNSNSYIERFGCNGCPAFRWNSCAVQTETQWGSYDKDKGNRMPNWERIGHEPYDAIDWNDVGSC